MSAKTKQEFHTWDTYVEEARLEPFVLKVSDEETLTFEAPSGVALMRVMQGYRGGDLELILRAIAGDNWDRVYELLGDASHKALPALVEDLMDHFELYEDMHLVAPDGGKRKARRPTEIRRLLDLGYRLPGEAQASS